MGTFYGKNITLRAFLISLGAHIFFLGLVVLTLKPQKAEYRPAVTFLGAILEKRDLDIPIERRAFSQKTLTPSNVTLPAENTPRITGNLSADKPATAGSIPDSPKRTFKPKFNTDEDTTAQTTVPEPNVNPTVPPYNPLQLDPDDKD